MVPKINPAQLMNPDDHDSHRIKLDLSRVNDKYKDMRKTITSGNFLSENLGLKNI